MMKTSTFHGLLRPATATLLSCVLAVDVPLSVALNGPVPAAPRSSTVRLRAEASPAVLAKTWAGSTRTGPDSGQGYESMTVSELAAELAKVEAQIDLADAEYSVEFNRIYRNRNNIFVHNKADAAIERLDCDKGAKAKELAKDRIRADAQRERRPLFQNEQERIVDLDREIGTLKGYAKAAEDRFGRLADVHAKFEDSVWPAVKDLQAKQQELKDPLIDRMDKINEVGRRRFPEDVLFHPLERGGASGAGSPVDANAPTVPNRTLLATTVIEPILSDAEFLVALNKPMGGGWTQQFPADFYRAGLPTFDNLVSVNSVKYLNLYREYSDARAFLEQRYRGSDRQIYRIGTGELVKSYWGRRFLLQVRDTLLTEPDRGEFRIEIPDLEAYQVEVLQRVRPRPPQLGPAMPERVELPPTPEPPKEADLVVNGPDPNSPEGKIESTLNKHRRAVVTERLPDLEGAPRRENLVEPAEVLDRLKKGFSDQKVEALNDALKSEVDPRLRADVRAALDAVAAVHTDEVARVTVDRGNVTFSAQPVDVQRRISRGRLVAELFEAGLKNVDAVHESLWSKGLNRMFLAVGLWDIGWILKEQGLEAGGKSFAQLVFITTVLSLADAAGRQAATRGAAAMVVSGGIGPRALSMYAGGRLASFAVAGIGVAFVLWGLRDLYRRFYVTFIDAQPHDEYEDLILGSTPWTPPAVPATTGGGAVRTRATTRTPMGFFTTEGSPGFGMDREQWFAAFPDEFSLLTAIDDYENRLIVNFRGSRNVPPFFDRTKNHERFVKVIRDEWIYRVTEHIKQVNEAVDRHREMQAQNEASLATRSIERQRLDPKGVILATRTKPEVPKPGDTVQITIYYGVAAKPGDILNVLTRSTLVKERGTDRFEPRIGVNDVDLGIEQAYRVFKSEQTYTLTTPGDYVYTFGMRVGPVGVDPEPTVVKIRTQRTMLGQWQTSASSSWDISESGGVVQGFHTNPSPAFPLMRVGSPIFVQGRYTNTEKTRVQASGVSYARADCPQLAPKTRPESITLTYDPVSDRIHVEAELPQYYGAGRCQWAADSFFEKVSQEWIRVK